MVGTSSSLYVSPITGDIVALEVLQCIGYFRQVKEAIITTFTLNDYDFVGHGLLTTLLDRQITNGAKITLLTSPPPDDGSRNKFLRKYQILERLDRSGINVQLHDDLHAKVFLFLDNRDVKTTIVGSANLTNRGFGIRGAPNNLLELALITSDPDLYNRTSSIVNQSFLNHINTCSFSSWRSKNQNKIAWAMGGPKI